MNESYRVRNATKKDIEAFCDTLTETLLKAVAEGTPVFFNVEQDVSPSESAVPSIMPPLKLDYHWFGCTITIHVGRPAKKATMT